MQRIAIAGIHTGIGKTVVSAIVTEALMADYWKPVQAGNLEDSDSITVAKLLSNTKSYIHPEALKLQMAASPHTAAQMEQLEPDFRQFQLPVTENTLIIETAGGLLSPIDGKHTMADFIQYHQLPVLLVTQNYLGSINHTLLCIEVLRQRNISLSGLILNGIPNNSSESFISAYSTVPILCRIPHLNDLRPDTIRETAAAIAGSIKTAI